MQYLKRNYDLPSNVTVKELLDYSFNNLSRRTQQHLKIYEICAEDFLKFATEDSKEEDLRSWVNALGNVKRAIECRVDSLLYNYCLHKKSEKERWNFPDKIEAIQQLGIVAPDILKKINKTRNELEHQYRKPDKTDVGDAIGIAQLFLAATDELAIIDYTAPNEFKIELKRKEGLVKLIDYQKNVEKIAKIDDDDGWIELAKRLSGLLKHPSMSFHRRSKS
jgi:hypothetical protein